MIEKVSQIFLNGIKDTKGLDRLVAQLQDMGRQLYHNEQGLITEKLKGKMLPSIEAIFLWLEQKGLEPQTDAEQKRFLDEIVNNLLKVPQVKVTIAFEADNLFISKINDQISQALGEKIILDILVDESIVGGAIFEYAGKHRDYSVAPKVESFLKEKVGKYFPAERKVDEQ